jgi:hypothetical protein
MEIRIDHVQERAFERGATENEIYDTLETGRCLNWTGFFNFYHGSESKNRSQLFRKKINKIMRITVPKVCDATGDATCTLPGT